MHNIGTVPTFEMHNVGTVPTFKMCDVFLYEAYRNRFVGRLVCRSVGQLVSTKVSEKFGDIGWATEQTMKKGQRPYCS